MSTTAQIQEIYVGLLGRAADAEGLAYWEAEINGGVLTIEQLRANIVNEQPEYAANLGSLSRSDLVTTLYANLFERAPEAAGLAYWTTGGGSTVNADQLVLALSNGASIADRATLDNKTVAATYYTNNISTYSASTAAAAVADVDGSVSSIVSSQNVTDSLAAAGQATTAFGTANNEVITGTTSSNLFTAVFTDTTTGSSTTLDAADTLTDASSTDSDTLRITANNDIAAATDTGTVLNIETLDLRVDATTTAAATATEFEFEATDFTGVKTYKVDVVKSVSAINHFDLTDAEDGSTVIASTDFSIIDVETETAGDDLTIFMQNAGTSGSPGQVDITTTAAGDVTIYAAGYVDVDSINTGVLTVQAGEINPLTAAAATVIDVTAATGKATIDQATAAVIVNVNAAGNVSITDLSANTNLNVTTTGTITLADGGGDITTTTAVLSATGTSTADADSLSSLSISGNGAAAVFDLTAGADSLTNVTVTGSQNVTLKVDASHIDAGNDELRVTDNSTGTVTVEIGTAAGSVDTTGGGLIDRLELKFDNGGDTLTVASGQVVTITADQTAGGTTTLDVGTDALASSQSVTIDLDDETDDANAVDFDGFTITDAKTVIINANLEQTATGAAVTHILDVFTASDAKSNVTINMGQNLLSLDGAVTVSSTGTITTTGSGTITDGSLTLTAATFDASSHTGAVTLDGTALNVATIKTGSAADDVQLTNVNGGTFEMGAGDDRLTLATGDLSGTTTVINLGDGTADVLELQDATQLITGASGSITLTGVETIELDTGANQDIQASLLSGQTYVLESIAAGSTNSVDLIVSSTDTAIDVSTIQESTAIDSAVTGMTFVTSAAANTSSISITGMSHALNTITGSTVSGDTLTGGALADSFVYTADSLLFNSDNVGLDTIVGGASASGTYDELTVGTSASAFTIEADDDFSSISGVEQISSVDNNGAVVSITLGVSAEAAGITRVDLSADASGSDVNVVSAAAYTTSGVTIIGSAGSNTDTLTGGAGNDTISKSGTGAATIDGGAGNDTITGAVGAAADSLTGGIGDDTFVYVLTTSLFDTSQALEDTIAGGDGTDVIRVGAATTNFAITDTDVWTRASEVETIKAVATTTAEVSIDLDQSAHTAGIRTVDLSLVVGDAANTIVADEYTGIYEANLTLIGSLTGTTNITGGAGDDTITGGSAVETIDGGAGADTINVGSGIGDVVEFTVANGGGSNSATFAATAATAIVTTGMDIITGLGAGDDIHLDGYGTAASSTPADGVLDTDVTSGSDLSQVLATNGIFTVRGNYSSSVFTESATGSDTLFVYDADTDQTDADYEAVVLVGTGGLTFSVDSGTTGVVSIS